jgi:hypothetical protein
VKPNYIETVRVGFDFRILRDYVETSCEVLHVSACRGVCSKCQLLMIHSEGDNKYNAVG